MKRVENWANQLVKQNSATSSDPDEQSSAVIVNRRSFLGKGVAAGIGAAGLGMLHRNTEASDGLVAGDAAILRFLAAVEIIETDVWQQYNELGGIQDAEVPGGSG